MCIHTSDKEAQLITTTQCKFKLELAASTRAKDLDEKLYGLTTFFASSIHPLFRMTSEAQKLFHLCADSTKQK